MKKIYKLKKQFVGSMIKANKACIATQISGPSICSFGTL